MPNYTKLFNSIVTSTIWTEDDKTRIVWITMLALADQNGEVHASIPGLARLAGVSLEDAEKAIEKFLSPDAYSRTPDNEGRRIACIDGGWELLNHSKYRRMASAADQKEATARRQKRFRDRNATVTVGANSNASVTHSNASVTVGTDIAEAEADAKAEKIIPPNPQGDFCLIPEEPQKSKPPKTVTPEQLRIGRILNQGRRETTLFSESESKAFKACDFVEEEIQLVEAFYRFEERHNEPLHRRTGLLSLLNHWADEVGKAQAWARKYGRPINKPINLTGK